MVCTLKHSMGCSITPNRRWSPQFSSGERVGYSSSPGGDDVTARPPNLQSNLGKDVAIHVIVPRILRDDQRGARCVRVMGLIERLHPSHLALPP